MICVSHGEPPRLIEFHSTDKMLCHTTPKELGTDILWYFKERSYPESHSKRHLYENNRSSTTHLHF